PFLEWPGRRSGRGWKAQNLEALPLPGSLQSPHLCPIGCSVAGSAIKPFGIPADVIPPSCARAERRLNDRTQLRALVHGVDDRPDLRTAQADIGKRTVVERHKLVVGAPAPPPPDQRVPHHHEEIDQRYGWSSFGKDSAAVAGDWGVAVRVRTDYSHQVVVNGICHVA